MKIRLMFFALVFVSNFFVASGYGQVSKIDAHKRFIAAEAAYKDDKFQEAIAKYEEIILGGKTSGPIYYNLANSYFKIGNIGKAILNYERAKRIIPRDSDLIFNAAYVQSKIPQVKDSRSINFIARAWQRHISFYSVDEMVLIVSCLLAALGVLVLLSLYLKWTRFSKVVSFSIFFLLLSIYFTGLVAKINIQKGSAIILQDSQAKFEPRENSTTHFKLLEGVSVKIIKLEDDWIKVQRFDGKLGWILSVNASEI